MNKRGFLQEMTFKRITNNEVFTGKYHYKTVESAQKDAMEWIQKNAKELQREVLQVRIIDKETKEIVWNWEVTK